MKSARNISHSIIRRDFRSLTASIVLAAFLILSDTGECQTSAPSDSYLVGTIISKMFTGAVIKDTKGEQSFYRIHEKLPDGSQIVKVTDDHILLRGSDGLDYEMYLVPGALSVATVKPYSTSDPFAGATRKPPEERPLSAYEKRVQKLPGRRLSSDE